MFSRCSVSETLSMEKAAENNEKPSLLESLEHRKNWDGVPMCKFQGFWCPVYLFHPLQSFQHNFRAQNDDVIISSVPKSGTTWMKALLFSIIRRNDFPIDQSPLLSTSCHSLVQSLECYYYSKEENPHLQSMARPRLFSTHLPHQALSKSIIHDSKSKIVYICRNPLDQFVSERHFLVKRHATPRWSDYRDTMLPIEQGFDMLCDGVQAFGPYWDHLLGYWKASLENPDKVLFLKYEDMKRDPISHVNKIARFVGFPFTEREEETGLVEEIATLCSFDKLKDLEVNKTGVHFGQLMNSSFYRKGDVRDWTNHLSPETGERMRKVLEEKLGGSGLSIDI